MNKEYNLVEILRTLLKWKKQILIATLAAGVIAAVFSFFFMDNYYKSFATFYPINLENSDRAVLFATEKAITVGYYGGKEDVNRVLTISKSASVANYLVEKYNLADHYKINKSKKYWRTKVLKEFEENYKAIKTEQGAIEISILDTDTTFAYNMLNDALAKIDVMYRKTINEERQGQIESVSKQIEKQQMDLTENSDSLAMLNKLYHIIIKASGEKSELIDGSDPKGIELYKTLYQKQKSFNEELVKMLTIREQLKVSLANNSHSLSIIDAPFVPDKKEKPVRSLIVLSTMLLVFVFGLLAALLVDQVNDIRKQL